MQSLYQRMLINNTFVLTSLFCQCQPCFQGMVLNVLCMILISTDIYKILKNITISMYYFQISKYIVIELISLSNFNYKTIDIYKVILHVSHLYFETKSITERYSTERVRNMDINFLLLAWLHDIIVALT